MDRYIKSLTQAEYEKVENASLNEMPFSALCSKIIEFGSEWKAFAGHELPGTEVSGEFIRVRLKGYVIVGRVNTMGEDTFDLYATESESGAGLSAHKSNDGYGKDTCAV